MHVQLQVTLDLLESRSHAVASGRAVKLEASPPRLPANEDEPQKLEGLRSTEPSTLAALGRIATKLQQSGLVPVKFETKLLEPLAHRIPEAPRISFVLEASDQIIGVAHDDHLALGLLPPPLLSPEIEDIVQVDVGKQW